MTMQRGCNTPHRKYAVPIERNLALIPSLPLAPYGWFPTGVVASPERAATDTPLA